MLRWMTFIVVCVVAASVLLAEDNLDFWLKNAKPSSQSAPAGKAAAPGGSAATTKGAASQAASEPSPREDALPGAIEMSDGKVIPGMLYTTREKTWIIYTEQDKLWHHVPFLAVLSLTAKVVEEQQELEWRWKEMGTPERVYTGRSFPTRRFLWTLKLADGTSLTGAIKGQPLWMDAPGGTKVGPLTLAERSKGEMGQKLTDLVYVKRVIVSRRVMEQVTGNRQ